MDSEELEGVKFSEFPSQTPVNADEVVGLHSGDNARFSIANIVAAVRQGLANIFVPKTDVGVADGVASLDSTGKVPSSQLPPISSDAEDITYDPTTSGLTATDVQAALDELAEGKAAKADLTSIQATGTTNTTGAAIPAGAYFYLNGILHQAKTQIDQNATFTVNTNCEQVPNGGFNALETAIAGKGNTKYTGYYAATARTINHSVDVDKNFLILTTGVSSSGDRAMGIFMGFVSATNAAASRVFKVFEPSTGQYPCTISVSTAGQISVTTTVAYVRVTILEFERTVF